MRSRFVVLSGCSGGGKSTLLTELQRRGFAVVEEPGRGIVREETASGGQALPWIDLAAFARRAIQVAIADLQAVGGEGGWVFFDRSVIDALAALQHATAKPVIAPAETASQYHNLVFFTPPWPELFTIEAERRHGLHDAITEYERLMEAFSQLDYRIFVLPKVSVSARADLVLQQLGPAPRA